MIMSRTTKIMAIALERITVTRKKNFTSSIPVAMFGTMRQMVLVLRIGGMYITIS